jgi:mono/diheme cytochrome c family protein
MPISRPCALLLALLALAPAVPATAQHQHGAGMAAPPDGRTPVSLPGPMRTHILANMRDHLSSLQEIQAALAAGAFERAADVAEQRLGMTSLKLHGAAEMAPNMPAAMQAIGTEMHRLASRFAVEATSASASGDVRGPLAALAKVTAQCVACHGAYRVE